MAEVLVRIVDRGGVDPAVGYGDSKRGDVIAVCPNGWGWTPAELTNPDWRIVRVPFTAAECDALLTLGDGNPQLARCWKRKYGIDASILPAGVKAALLAPRVAPYILDATAYLSQFRAAVILKAVLS
jgi:hypothetical protein